MYSVWCRPGVHWVSNHMASQVVWIGQFSGASLDLSHSDLVRYRCYKRKSVGAHPVHLQICVLLLRRAYTWYQEYITPRVCNCLHNLYAVLRRQNFTSRDMVQKVMLANSAKCPQESCTQSWAVYNPASMH